MDSGFLAEGERLEDDYDLLQELLPVEILGIMDQLLCFEVCSIGPFSAGILVLILMTGIVDGMAYGVSPFPIALHVPLH